MSFGGPTKTAIGPNTWVNAEETYTGVSEGTPDAFFAAPCDLGTYHIENNSSFDVNIEVQGANKNPDGTWTAITSTIVRAGKTAEVTSDKFHKFWHPYKRVHFNTISGDSLDGNLVLSIAARGLDSDGGLLAKVLGDNTETPPENTVTARLKNLETLITDLEGSVTVSSNVLAKYNIADVEKGVVSYYGYASESGKWYIMKEDKSTGAYRYANGASGYETAWTNRDTHTYDYLYNLTGL